jgi:hypothetical protein
MSWAASRRRRGIGMRSYKPILRWPSAALARADKLSLLLTSTHSRNPPRISTHSLNPPRISTHNLNPPRISTHSLSLAGREDQRPQQQQRPVRMGLPALALPTSKQAGSRRIPISTGYFAAAAPHATRTCTYCIGPSCCARVRSRQRLHPVSRRQRLNRLHRAPRGQQIPHRRPVQGRLLHQHRPMHRHQPTRRNSSSRQATFTGSPLPQY